MVELTADAQIDGTDDRMMTNASSMAMATSSDLVLREDRDGIAILTLNRPEKMNSLNTEMFAALERYIRDLERPDR